MEWPVVGESTSSTKLLNVEYVSDPVQSLYCKLDYGSGFGFNLAFVSEK